MWYLKFNFIKEVGKLLTRKCNYKAFIIYQIDLSIELTMKLRPIEWYKKLDFIVFHERLKPHIVNVLVRPLSI